MIRTVGLAAVLLLATGCASALHAPDAVDALTARHAPPGAAESAELVQRATTLFGERTLDSAEAAAELWTRAAAGESHRIEATLGLAQTAIWIASRQPDAARRVASAGDAVRAGQLCRRTDPGDLRCAYWLALALGVQARERRTTGLDALPRMVELLDEVADADPGLDHGGAHRALALVYLRAPGWPSGPGDPDLGLEHAEQAVELAPDYPPNRLALAEGLRATEDSNASAAEFATAARLAARWRERGHPDAAEWLELAEARKGLR